MSIIERPMFNPYSFTEGERDNIRRISVQLGFLIDFENDFSAGAALMHEIRRQMKRNNLYNREAQNLVASNWKSVVARDGAVTLYKIQDIINNINASLIDVPSFYSFVDQEKKNLAAKAFRLAFPDVNIIRQAVTHTPDITKNTEKFSEHTINGDYNNGNILLRRVKHIIIQPNVSGDVFTCSYRGKSYSYNINLEVSERLNVIIKDFIIAFNSASIRKVH